MQTLEAIAQRRSIRKFQDQPIPDGILHQILHAATLAPSGKNRQPWHFVVVREDKRAEMVRVMREAIERFKEQGQSTGSSIWSANVMEQAPVTIFVFNPNFESQENLATFEEWLWNVVDTQSIGAAIQNLLLAAQELGVGTLWICDVFFAYQELCEWLGEKHQMIAAISLGYADEAPSARPRKPLDEVTTWL